jgi:hypothetical protein
MYKGMINTEVIQIDTAAQTLWCTSFEKEKSKVRLRCAPNEQPTANVFYVVGWRKNLHDR